MYTDQAALDALELYLGPASTSVLGFSVDSKLYDFSWLLECDYVQEDFRVNKVPGVQLLEVRDMEVQRMIPKMSKSVLSVRYYDVVDDVEVRCLYNGSDLLVIGFSTLSYTVGYTHAVLQLHRMVTGCGVGLDGHRHEAERVLSSIVATRYTPVTSTYMDVLSAVCDGFSSGHMCAVNKKYDGVPMWVYMSSTTPASLLKQTKSQRRVLHRYVGRVADFADTKLQTPLCIPVERVVQGDGAEYVAVDVFTEGDINDDYIARLSLLKQLLPQYTGHHGPHSLHIKLRGTDSMVIGAHPGYYSLTAAMTERPDNVDGFVVYVGANRPMKLKPLNCLTVDLEYHVHHGVGVWHQQQLLPCTLQDPDYTVTAATTDGVIVVEVRVADGSIVRTRPDRTHGNSSYVIERVVAAYQKESKKSTVGVWEGVSVRFSILANRMFKRYIHFRYLHRGANVVDFGSGHGGDIFIWRDMDYRVLCVELNTERYNVLARKIRDTPKITAVNDSMCNVDKILRAAVVKYRCASFMRTLSNLSHAEIVQLLASLLSYGCVDIIIVTMVLDYVEEYSYTYRDESFSISISNNTANVSYTVDSNSITYTDNCYSISEWMAMFTESGYRATMVPQEMFMLSAYGVAKSQSTVPSFTDVAFVLVPF